MNLQTRRFIAYGFLVIVFFKTTSNSINTLISNSYQNFMDWIIALFYIICIVVCSIKFLRTLEQKQCQKIKKTTITKTFEKTESSETGAIKTVEQPKSEKL